MGTETLNSYTTTGIVLTDSGSYNSPFTVTTAGTIQAQAGSDGVSSTAAAPYLLNEGLISGGIGLYNFFYGGTGGAGVNLNSGTLSNTGNIAGGAGGGAGKPYTGGAGGTGVYLSSGTLGNTGSITGGAGGAAGAGGTGGTGVDLNSGTLSNTGSITGGAGGYGYYFGGSGGAGVDLNSGTLSNTGSIAGGAGGAGNYDDGIGGAGINVSDAYVYNSGGITGGSGSGDGADLGVNSTLVNAGMISGGTGVFASSAGYVTNSGTITGASYFGVDLQGGTVTNYGTITGAAEGGVYVGDSGNVTNSGSINGGHGDGVFLVGSGSVTNTGDISASGDGVYLGAGGTVTNTGAYVLIFGGIHGVIAANAAAYVNNSGTITGASGDGVDLGDGGTVTNSGLISGGGDGVNLGDVGTLTNTGTITSSGHYGIYLGNGGTVANSGSAAFIYSGVNGVVAKNTAIYVINTGTISGAHIGVYLYQGGTVTSTDPSALISGNSDGVYVKGAYSTIINSGTITGGGDGVYFQYGGTVTNAGTSALIYGGNFGLNVEAASDITNSGTITSSYNGIYLGQGGSVTNTASYSLIYGSNDGLDVEGAAAVVSNAGSIIGSSFNGISLERGGTVTNTGTSAIISGGNIGVYASNAYATVINSGTITGGFDAVYLRDGGTVFNAGTSALMYGSNDGIAIANIGGGVATNAGTVIGGFDGVYLSVGAVYNTGSQALISGSNAGVYAKLGSDPVTNAGTINSSGYAGIDLAEGGTAINSGTVSGSGQYGVDLGGAGTVGNTGANALIYGGYNGIRASGAAYIYNAGTIIGASGDGINLDDGGTVINSGIISGDGGTAVEFNGNYTNLLVIDPGAVFNGAVEGGSGLNILEVAGISRAPLAGIGTEFTGFTQLSFASGAAWTLEGDSAGLNGDTLTGFTKADALDVGNLTYYGPQYLMAAAGGVLSVTEGATSDAFTFSGDAGYTYTITSDGGTGTEIEEVTCFAAGTRIATARGHVKVEDLEIGDLVRTVHAGLQPVKWIGTRSYAAPFCNHRKVLPIRIQAGAIADGIPARDLFVSPGHAICIDDALIHAARLVNGRTITQLERVESVTYYHVELENHEVILAEACPAETFMGEYFRPQFHNAADFAARYPGAAAPEVHALPFLAHGFQLAAILRRLRARAGMAAPGTPGVLRGYVDAITPSMVCGWAVDASAPDEPVILDILAGRTLIGRVIANIHRPDVAAAGYGAGDHGFEFALPAGITERITVRRAADGARLPHPAQQARAA